MAKFTIWGANTAYKMNHPGSQNIFDLWTLPESIAAIKQDIVDKIMLDMGEFGLVYQDPDFIAEAISTIGKAYYHTFDRWYNDLTVDYKVTDNYDRDETITTVHEQIAHGKTTGKTTDESSNDTTNKLSAFDSNTLVDSSGNTDTGSNTSNVESTSDGTNNYTTTVTNKTHGNIGVTTASKMIMEDIDMRKRLNIFNLISDVFVAELCIPIY